MLPLIELVFDRTTRQNAVSRPTASSLAFALTTSARVKLEVEADRLDSAAAWT